MDDERGGGVNIGRRRLLLGAVAAPFVITTPGLLMPVRKIITPTLSTLEIGGDLFVVTDIVVHNSLTIATMAGRSLDSAMQMDCSFVLTPDASLLNDIKVGSILKISR
jgi:hypothetical protein